MIAQPIDFDTFVFVSIATSKKERRKKKKKYDSLEEIIITCDK